MEIRKADSSDRNKLIELMQKADNRTKEWAEGKIKGFVLKDKGRMILVAEDNGHLIGFLGLKEYEDNPARQFTDLTQFAWITWIAVLPEYRNRIWGSKLLKSAEEYVNGKRGLILDCRQKVVAFYMKNGYNVAGEYLHNEIPRYVMTKELK